MGQCRVDEPPCTIETPQSPTLHTALVLWMDMEEGYDNNVSKTVLAIPRSHAMRLQFSSLIFSGPSQTGGLTSWIITDKVRDMEISFTDPLWLVSDVHTYVVSCVFWVALQLDCQMGMLCTSVYLTVTVRILRTLLWWL